MEFEYVATSDSKRVVKGKLSASSEDAAVDILSYGGYRVLSLRQVIPFFQAEQITSRLISIKAPEVIMFYRQFALLLRSGTDAITSLELLRAQITNRAFKKVLAEVVMDVRNGAALSDAMLKHPRAFPEMHCRLIAVGEQTGNLEDVLKRAADYMERRYTTQKTVKNALIYPAIVFIVAIGVVGLMVGFVLPVFANLYKSFGAELPPTTKAVIVFSNWSHQYGLWVLAGAGIALVAGYLYTKTLAGRYQWGKLMLTMPRIGRINLLNELSRACRSMALLYSSGLPLPDVMTLVTRGTSNRAMATALVQVHQGMIAGQGLSGPMRKNELFLPLMVQMTAVGEETGNLDETLNTVADSYEAESDDKTKNLVSLITPALTIVIGVIVGFIAISMLSAMYSIYGQANM